MAELRGHDAISEVMANRFITVPWRVGRKVPRNLYACTNLNKPDDGVAFGQVDSSWLAEHIVGLHNKWLDRVVDELADQHREAESDAG